MPSVLALLQQVLASPVVGMLVEDPDAFLNLSRVNFMEAPAVQQVGQVITELHHLTAEVWMLIDADSMPAGMLEF